MIDALKNSHALRMLLLVGGGLVALILAIHYFSKKQPGVSGTSTDGTNGQTPTEVSNTTVLINGYPNGQSPPTAVPAPPGGSGGHSGGSSGGNGGSGSSGGHTLGNSNGVGVIPQPVTRTVSVGGTAPATPAPTAPSAAMLAASQAFGVPVQTIAAAAVKGTSAPTTPLHPASAETKTLITKPNTAHTLTTAQIASIRKATATNAAPRTSASQSSAAQKLSTAVAQYRTSASSAMNRLRLALGL